jgi:hypothetical protein
MTLVAGFGACLPAVPYQNKAAKANMAQRIQSQFVLTRFAGFELREAGTVLVVQKDGIAALPGSGVGFTVPTFGNNYKDGRIRRDVMSALVSANNAGLRNLAVGEGVYLLKVQATDSNVILDVQSCGACNPSTPDPYPVRATVTFPFKKGFIDTVPVETVMGVIGEVFSFANAGPATQPPAQYPVPPSPPVDAAPPLPPQNPPANRLPEESSKEPARIELGQTVEQVQSMLGRPEKVVDLGSKKIYVYKDLKITFLDGVVSDVQ